MVALESSQQALVLVKALQQCFVQALENCGGESFQSVEWVRDAGRHGGGQRFFLADSAWFGRASVNVSQVHYEDDPEWDLLTATALSTIIHPLNPHAPSVHMHISWTEMKNGSSGWRMMADLNPALPTPGSRDCFLAALKKAAPEPFETATAQGDSYFYIPALERHRGVAHFYLEEYNSGAFADDLALASRVGNAVIECYIQLLEKNAQITFQPLELAEQLAYHTLYFFQVLTLDRGTIAGLLAHNQNDVGILGSLPPRIDRDLLASWKPRMTVPQNQLLENILSLLPTAGTCIIDDALKQKLADVLRAHYRRYFIA